MRQVSERQMVRLREKLILMKLKDVFGLEANDTWPNGKTVQAAVREGIFQECVMAASKMVFEDWVELGGDEAAWRTQLKDVLGEEPDGDEISVLDLQMPTKMHEALRMREAAEAMKEGR